MNRIKKYNQVLFSIIGTVLLIILLFAGVSALIDLFDKPTYLDNRLIVQDELDSLKEQNIRNQIISLEGIRVFDTTSGIYLIPVYHKQLADPSTRNEKVFGLLDAKIRGNYEYYEYGNYNNLVLYDFSKSNSTLLLQKRMNIDRFNIFTSKKRKLIVLTGWDSDTNKDGKLGEEDFKQACVYDHNTGETRQVENNTFRLLDYQYLDKVDKIVFKVTELKKDSIKFEDRPEFLVSYSFERNDLTPLVDMSTLNMLQDIIDN